MKITSSEMPYCIQMVMKKHNLTYPKAIEYISTMNGELDEIAKKVRRRRAEDRKRKPSEFSKEFRKMKSSR